MEAMEYYYLLAVGILLIGVEALTFTFMLFFLGIGFIVVALLSYFGVYENAWAQIASAFLIALISAFVLRKPLLERLSKPSKQQESKTHTHGIGIIEDGMVKFDGSYWQSANDLSQFRNGQRVKVIKTQENKVYIEALTNT